MKSIVLLAAVDCGMLWVMGRRPSPRKQLTPRNQSFLFVHLPWLDCFIKEKTSAAQTLSILLISLIHINFSLRRVIGCPPSLLKEIKLINHLSYVSIHLFFID